MECRQLGYKKKIQQLENSHDIFQAMLKREGYIAYSKNITFNNDTEIKNYINTLDVAKYFGVENGENIPCLRVSCNNAYGANFYKDDGITYFKCHLNCNCKDKDTGKGDAKTLFGLVYEIYKQQHKTIDYNAIMYNIKMAFCQDYESAFYKEYREIVEYNRAVIENLHHRKYLARLFKRRNLMGFYKDFTELALIYMKEDEEIPYSFYCSNAVVKRTFKHVFGTSSSNYQIEKVNILVALGLVEKLDEDSCSKRMREKIIKAKTIAGKGQGYMKSTNAYKMVKLTPEALREAEKRAKIIVENKIYNIKQDTFKEIEAENKREAKKAETFIKRAKAVIKNELKAKGYIQMCKIAGKIAPKYKYYSSRAEKEKLLAENIKRIKSDYKLESILVDDAARKYFKLTRSVKNDTELIIKRNIDLTSRKKVNKDELVVEMIEKINGLTIKTQISDDIDTSDVPW